MVDAAKSEVLKLQHENLLLKEVIEELLLNLDGVCEESLRTKRRAAQLYSDVKSCSEASLHS